MGRMVRHLYNLKDFNSSYPRHCPLSYLSSTNTPIPDLFAHQRPPNKTLSPPSFHVPAILDAFRSSPRYQSLVFVVPGEADGYCAQYLAEHGGTVITSDSDLLVHEVGQGRVMFFRDIYIDGNSDLTAATFTPYKLSERFGMASSNLCRLAYERRCCTHSTLPQILRSCAEDVRYPDEYEEFCQEYLHHETASLPVSLDGQPVPIDSLDPRLSELVLQLGHQPNDEEWLQENKFFLPILIEDPGRGSAWEQSTPIRQLAYTIARMFIPGTTSIVQEYRRVNTTVQKGRVVPLMPLAAAKSYVVDELSIGHRLESSGRIDNPDIFWMIFCLAMDINECLYQEKQSHALQTLQSYTKSQPQRTSKVDWDIIHFTAQLQASYYSFRILKQILSLMPKSMANNPLITKVQSIVSSFPSLTRFPSIDGVIDFLHGLNGVGVMDIIAEFVDVPQEPKQPDPTMNTQKKVQKPNKSPKGNTTGPKPQLSRNIFDVLDQS